MIYPILSGSFGSNSYVIAGGKTVVVDPGIEVRYVVDKLRELYLVPDLVVNTHCHFDHVKADFDLVEMWGVKLALHELDAAALEGGVDDVLLGGLFDEKIGGLKVDLMLVDGQVIDLGESKLEVVHTPGHTKGSICLYEPKSRSLFTGDTVFVGGVGRTDFPGGSISDLRNSIKRLLDLKNRRGVDVIYPGHGPIGSGDDILGVYEMFF